MVVRAKSYRGHIGGIFFHLEGFLPPTLPDGRSVILSSREELVTPAHSSRRVAGLAVTITPTPPHLELVTSPNDGYNTESDVLPEVGY